MNVQRDEHQPHWKSRGEEAKGQLGLCTQDVATEPCREVQGQGQMCRVRLSSWGGRGRGRGRSVCLAQGRGGGGCTQTSRAGRLGSSGRWTPTRDLTILPCASPRPVTVAAVTMLPPRTASLLTLLLAVGSLGQRAQRPPRPPSPISAIQPTANFDAQRVGLEELERRAPSFAAPVPACPHGACSSFQGPGSLWPWPLRAAPCRSRATGLRPPHCM